GATPPGVQIPLSPPQFKHLQLPHSTTHITLRITWNILLEYFSTESIESPKKSAFVQALQRTKMASLSCS
ncbi:hypothetical protein ACOYUI_005362, partial [Escherichia coli]